VTGALFNPVPARINNVVDCVGHLISFGMLVPDDASGDKAVNGFLLGRNAPRTTTSEMCMQLMYL
jgi:hypothetical protein